MRLDEKYEWSYFKDKIEILKFLSVKFKTSKL